MTWGKDRDCGLTQRHRATSKKRKETTVQ